ncbi:MAG: hypothetical protein LQ349_003098 [Xanthoria aureola]|nr:MAG: hypothetical protein LQ349_003098 [Xanthoria aureola]
MQLQLPRDLHYPITVTELLKQPNDNVERFAPLFSYSYTTTVTEGNKFGDEFQVEKAFPTKFESSVDGVLKTWSIHPGAVISEPGFRVADIDELCAHGVQFHGMCVDCGKDMTESTYVTEQLDATRATINMVHDKTSLVVSQDEATRFENEAKRRLLTAGKLSLVVDLDQTVIQACVEPTIGDWMRDSGNPNYEAVKDVRQFQLVEDAAGTRGCWYYIKLRPGLEGFLQRMSAIYEMHIYTMGTRGYAQKIAAIIDPHKKFFGDRILSRDESGSLVAKSLQRLFPVDTKMVLIIDDRGDVWKWNENLIKVTPYDFFVGIGDINSSFLPKKPGNPPASKLLTTTQQEAVETKDDLPTQQGRSKASGNEAKETSEQIVQAKDTSAATDTSALEQLVSMGAGDDPRTLEEQTSRQDETLAAQLEDRPLLKKQLQLEQDDAAKAAVATDEKHESGGSNGISADSSVAEKPRHHILEDHDRQLEFLEQFLGMVHAKYFEQFADLRASRRKQPITDADLASVPDVKAMMPSIKKTVLDGVIIVLSGVVPIGWDIQNSDLAMWAKSFGAKVEEEVTRKTTHLIAARNRTAKVRQALKRGKGKVKIVGPQWLVDSLTQWTKLDETNYLLDVEETETSQGANGGEGEGDLLSESEDVPTEHEEEDTDAPDGVKAGSKPALSIKVRPEDESDFDDLVPDDLEDQESPLGGTHKDWDDMNDELKDFLGSEAGDGDESDGGTSVRSEDSSQSTMVQRFKRTREVDDSEDEGTRKRAAPSRRTNLSQTSIVAKTPPEEYGDAAWTNGQQKQGTDVERERSSQVEAEVVTDDEDAELEKSLAAEMEKAAAEEEEDEG